MPYRSSLPTWPMNKTIHKNLFMYKSPPNCKKCKLLRRTTVVYLALLDSKNFHSSTDHLIKHLATCSLAQPRPLTIAACMLGTTTCLVPLLPANCTAYIHCMCGNTAPANTPDSRPHSTTPQVRTPPQRTHQPTWLDTLHLAIQNRSIDRSSGVSAPQERRKPGNS